MLTVSDWVLIATTAFLGAIALSVPYLSELSKRKAFAPKLRMDFVEQPPSARLSSWRSSVDPTLEEPVYAFHLRVSNEGKSLARQCEVLLEAVWLYDASGRPQRLEDFSPTNIRPGAFGTLFANLNPGRPPLLWNLGHISSRAHQKREEARLFVDVPGRRGAGLRFLLDLAEYPNRQVNCFLPGTYALQVSLYAENASPVRKFLKLVWTGKWQKAESEMFREIVIREIPRVE